MNLNQRTSVLKSGPMLSLPFLWIALGTCSFLNLLFLSTSSSAQNPTASTPIPPSYFGLTVQRDRISPNLDYSTVRTWDTWPEPDWADSNPSSGVYDFTNLDIFLAANPGRDVIYTLGRTPQWASSQPNTTGLNGVGQCAPPTNMQDWDNYIQAVVTHVAGKVKYWELWNEPINPGYYCGDIPTMVIMAQHAKQIIKNIDPTAKLLSPALTSQGGPAWLASFLAQGGAGTVDVIAFHGYKSQTAEDILPLLASYQAAATNNGVGTLPVWDTEASNASAQTSDLESAFLAKYYLLQWSQGVSRFVWYAYDANPGWGQLGDPTTGAPSPAANAYAQVHDWMVGATLFNPCSKDPSGNWSCGLSRDNYQAEALWNSGTTSVVSLPSQFVQYRDLQGNIYPINNGNVPVGNVPVLAETAATDTTPLGFAPVAAQVFGNPPFTVFASSASKSAVSYSVISGPATISGSTVTLTGAGTVTLGATQPASLGFAAGSATISFNVAPSAPGLSMTSVAPQVFGVAPFSLSVSSASTGAVTYTVVSGPATISGSTITVRGAGTIVVSASQAATQNYSAATASTQFTVAKGTPTLAFASIPDWAYGTTNTTLSVSATSSSNGGIAYAVVSGPATISYHTVTPTGLGTVVLSATVAANSNYNALTTTTSFNVVAAPIPALAFATIAPQVYGGAVTVSASSPSSGTITYCVVSGPASISGKTVTLTGTGTVLLRASQAANYAYAAATATTSFSVSPVVPTLKFASIPSQTYGAAPFSVSASSASTGAITYALVSGPATLSGSTVTITGAGTITLSASQAATQNYTAATATVQVVVAKAASTVIFAPIADWAYGNTNTTLSVSATSSSPGGITYAVVSGPATIAYHTVTPTGVGVVVLSATVASTSNYCAATTTTSFNVVPAPVPALAFSPIATQNYGTVMSVSASSASTGVITYAVVSGPATISGHTVTLTGTGTVVLSATQAPTYYYAGATATISFGVTSATPALSFAPIAPQVYGATPLTVNASSSSNGAVTYAVVSGPATISGTKLTITGAGTITLSATQVAAKNYTVATATTQVNVAKATPTLSFAPVADWAIGSSNTTLSVSATSSTGGGITYGVVSGPATISFHTVTPTNQGNVVLSATLAATSNYNAVTATTSFKVIAAPVPTLVFSPIAQQTKGATIAVSAVSPSTGAITYSVVSGPATISGQSVHLTGAGTVVLSAKQAPNYTYAAGSATLSFSVK